jgi:hypothetical protein
MRPQVVTLSAVATSAPLVMDRKQNPVNIGIGVTVTGTATYTVEHTFDDILSGVTPVWLPNATLAAATTSQSGNYAFPITAIRLNVTAWTSGTVTMTVLQGSSQ